MRNWIAIPKQSGRFEDKFLFLEERFTIIFARFWGRQGHRQYIVWSGAWATPVDPIRLIVFLLIVPAIFRLKKRPIWIKASSVEKMRERASQSIKKIPGSILSNQEYNRTSRWDLNQRFTRVIQSG